MLKACVIGMGYVGNIYAIAVIKKSVANNKISGEK